MFGSETMGMMAANADLVHQDNLNHNHNVGLNNNDSSASNKDNENSTTTTTNNNNSHMQRHNNNHIGYDYGFNYDFSTPGGHPGVWGKPSVQPVAHQQTGEGTPSSRGLAVSSPMSSVNYDYTPAPGAHHPPTSGGMHAGMDHIMMQYNQKPQVFHPMANNYRPGPDFNHYGNAAEAHNDGGEHIVHGDEDGSGGVGEGGDPELAEMSPTEEKANELAWAMARASLQDRPEGSVKLFVGQIPTDMTETEVTALFESVQARVWKSSVLRQRKTGKHRGAAFVVMFECDDAFRCIETMHDKLILPNMELPIQVKLADGEERLFEAAKLFVGKLPRTCSEEDLRLLFYHYGQIRDIYIMRDENQASRGCAFVTYSDKRHALLAIEALHLKTVPVGQTTSALVVKLADSAKQKKTRQRTRRSGNQRDRAGTKPRAGYAPPRDSVSVADEIRKLKTLKDDGTLTHTEFLEAKAKLLRQI